MFIQSSVPEHAELHLLLSMITPLGWLERVPTYKEALDNVKDKDLHTYGFLGYPLLQSADIVMYGEPEGLRSRRRGSGRARRIDARNCAPLQFFLRFQGQPEFHAENCKWRSAVVQLLRPANEPMIPRRQDLAPTKKRSNGGYSSTRAGKGVKNFFEKVPANINRSCRSPVLREPDVLLTQTPRIPGTDGRKMSKSYGNFISLSESDDSIRTKSRAMMTDPARKRRTDPGNPDVCPVYDWHKLFSPPETLSGPPKAAARRHRLHRVQIGDGRQSDQMDCAGPRPPRGIRRASRQGCEFIDEGRSRPRGRAKTMSRVREAVSSWKEKREEESP